MSNNTSAFLSTARLTVDLGAIARNWKLLGSFAPNAATGAAVKANAYGMGLEQVTATLAQAGCRHFFVATPGEGIRARKVAANAEIFVLGGLTERNAPHYQEAGLIPVLNDPGEMEIWARRCRQTGNRKPCALHFDTGMGRLGLDESQAMELAAENARLNSISPVLIMSHLACADDPKHPMNAHQKQAFDRLCQGFPGIMASLANSAGILGQESFGYDLTRPGIALYGAEAIDGTVGPMGTVAKFEARILQVRHARKGETVGYGATHVLARDSVITTVGAGYGDGLPRSASGDGVALRAQFPGAVGHVCGRDVPLIGRVSMDSCMFDVTDIPLAQLEKTEWIELFGDNIAVDDLARASGTIGYEVLTGMRDRCERVYLETMEG
ncbi:MAG: alanine racemase [Nitratireductor sp.]